MFANRKDYFEKKNAIPKLYYANLEIKRSPQKTEITLKE